VGCARILRHPSGWRSSARSKAGSASGAGAITREIFRNFRAENNLRPTHPAEGFVAVDSKDGQATAAGDYAVKTGWEHALQAILEKHAVRSAIGAANNAKIIPGDATQTFPVWLEQNPKALISHAHFDMDVYWPTKQILPLCLPRMLKGAVLIFDELNCPSFLGETRFETGVIAAALNSSRGNEAGRRILFS
jgi:hypothetical protein